MRLFLSSVFLFCCLNGFGQILSPMGWWEGIDWDLGKIKAELKSIELKEYTAIDYFGELKKTSTELDALLLFNSNNYISKADGIQNEKKGSLSTNYIIDSSRVEIRTNGFIGELKYNYSGVWHYDSRGNIIEFTFYRIDTIEWKELAKYNEKNQLIEEKKYNEKGKLEYLTSYSYDKNGNEIEYVFNGGSYSSKTKKNYNSSNQLIEEQNFDEDNKLERIYTYKYNSLGKLIEKNEIYMGELIQKEATTYNTKGDETTISRYDSKGNIYYSESYAYNNDGAVIEQVYTMEKEKTVASYEYDQKGNWTKKTEYTVSLPSALPSEYTITERKITYR